MDVDSLEKNARQLVSPGKGVLATDATDSTMDKRMEASGIEPNSELRRKFRELLLTTKGISEFISGVILNDEIIRQKTSDGIEFAKLIENQGILPGIKVDKKAHEMANFPGEKIAEGLDGLRDRFAEYKQMGARFAKWRAVITIGDGIPTDVCIESNAEALARYTALAQEAGFVPIVEPEVLMDGNHNIDSCALATKRTLKVVFNYLAKHKVYLSGIILKPNMIIPGKESGQEVSTEEIVNKTLLILKEVVPNDVAGICFLSGGQNSEDATLRLNEMNKESGLPWPLSFSFERALEGPALDVWKGDDSNWEAAQQAFYKRARLNSLARSGEYKKEMEGNDGK